MQGCGPKNSGPENWAGTTQGSLELDLAGKKWVIAKAGSLEELWDKMTGDSPRDEDFIPYWAEVWPASKVLAAHIVRCRKFLSGRTCLDLGCGLGVTSLVAGSLGARVVAMDIQFPALVFAGKNAVLNKVAFLSRVCMDWRKPAFKPQTFDIIWAADILYETRFCKPLAALMKQCLKPGGKIWIADPERNLSPKIWESFQESGFLVNEISREEAWLDSSRASVRLLELTPGHRWS